jgi:hypothetical protein
VVPGAALPFQFQTLEPTELSRINRSAKCRPQLLPLLADDVEKKLVMSAEL